MTTGMASIESILTWRERALQGFRDRQEETVVAVTSGAIPPPTGLNLFVPKFYSILSWNIQVFDEGKAESNPLVRDLVAWTIGKLGADLCIMLETRHNPGEVLRHVSNAERAAPMLGDRYHWLASEMTGKTYRPPKRIGLYGNDSKYFPKFFKGYSLAQENGEDQEYDTWALVYRNYMVFQAYYTVEQLDPVDESWTVLADPTVPTDNLGTVTALDEPHIYLRLRTCGTCNVRLGTVMGTACAGCRDANAKDALETLYHTINQFAFSFTHTVQHESYTLLVRTNPDLPSGDLTWGDGKLAVAHRTGSMLLSRALDDSLLGYVDAASDMYGRCPYVVPLEVRHLGNNLLVPVVAFHAPYIGDTVREHGIRGAALQEVGRGAIPAFEQGLPNAKKTIANFDSGIIIGDFNLNVGLGLGGAGGLAAKERVAYDTGRAMIGFGYRPRIEGLPTSLKTVYSSKKKPKGRKQPLLKEDLDTMGPATSAFLSSAYDNVLIKGASLQKLAVGTFVVDVIHSFARALKAGDPFPVDAYIAPDDEHRGAFDTLSWKQKAFYLYRRFVSDHLPVMVDLLIDPMVESDVQQIAETKGNGPVKFKG